MANMSYCRFENTSHDLQDCVDAMQEAETLLALDLSTHEQIAIKSMYETAQEFMNQYERLTQNER